jgi:hypothetical protein
MSNFPFEHKNTMTRREFAKYWNGVRPGLGKWTSPLWTPEQFGGEPQVKAKVFICVEPFANRLRWGDGTKADYWKWCADNLKGKVNCYSTDSDNKEEWWGFTEAEDVAWWRLRWE